MTSVPFDISSLIDFKPPRYLCEKCWAIWIDRPFKHKTGPSFELECPVCNVKYFSPEGTYEEMQEYFQNERLSLNYTNLIGHCQKLGTLAKSARRGMVRGVYPPYPPMRAFLSALSEAEHFVHFTSWGISDMIIGALKVTAQKVSVRGVVSNVDERQAGELTGFHDEAPGLDVVAFEKGAILRNSPHQKVFVVDGLLAFKGSTNFTQGGLRSAAEGNDMLEIVSDVTEVINLNNSYFSPVRARSSDKGDIEMYLIPF